VKKITASNLAVVLFFLGLLGLGLAIYSSYGLSWDEPTQLELGLRNFRYAFKGDPALLDMRDRWYGPLFEIFLIAVQSRGNPSQVYLSRHLLTFLTFFAGCLAFYFLARRYTRSAWLALLGTACLVLSPRIFADSFYNSKDIPFLALYTLNLFSLLWFIEQPSPLRGLVHALLGAALIAVRLPGLIILALTLLALLIEAVCKRLTWKTAGIGFALYLPVALAGCVLLWPALWPDPINGFARAFQFMSHFPHETTMLYLGERISSLALPWHYIPVWMAVTTPPFYLAGFALGLAAIGWRLVRPVSIHLSTRQRDELLVLAAFLGPILTVILLRSVLYDGWRQLFFVYPAFLLVMLTGLLTVLAWLDTHLSKRMVAVLATASLLIGMLPVAGWMLANHPYQNLYFNRLAGPDMRAVQQRFMLDYWGLSYRPGLEAILAQDSAAQVNIYMQTEAGERTIAILPPDQAARVHVVHKLSEADYFIGNYYMLTEPYPFKHELFSVSVGNAKILSVFRLSPDEKT
jgi:hypothetical protein